MLEISKLLNRGGYSTWIARRRYWASFLILMFLAETTGWSQAFSASWAKRVAEPGPRISAIQLNLNQYPASQLPAYKKLEITFQVATRAQNPQLPYDAAPPSGIPPEVGVSVEALFTPDRWNTVYTQPAFYYQDFDHQVRGEHEWFYPTANYAWKVRFAPPRAGEWEFKLRARDASGFYETAPQPFSVSPSEEHGFLRVSRSDPRYFEFEDGTYFPGLGYNMNFDHVSWSDPVLGNQANFHEMSANGIQFVRIWLSQWSIFGAAWNPWVSINHHTEYIPSTELRSSPAYPGSDFSLQIDSGYNPCMLVGFLKPAPAVKPNTTYRVRVRYQIKGLEGPRVSGKPFGLVAKTGDWLWGKGNECDRPGTGDPVTPYQSKNSSSWQILEGVLHTGEVDFLPNFYLAVENATAGQAYVDYVWIEEDLGNGQFGPNILPKPWMAHHLYFDQRSSYAFDKVLELAEQEGIYLKPVIMEKNDPIFNHIDFDGKPIADDPRCYDDNPANNPAECPGNQWFYGNGKQVTKVRWLQQAWWRFLQARWGYSTHIHSWELLNEGDPADAFHYQLAQAFGKYMHQFNPNAHLVSTSFWHSFPRDEFWANSQYPDIDFADIHQYVKENEPEFKDTALSTYELSMTYGALQPLGANKPLVRGETGFGGPASPFDADHQGIWLHNYLWGQINSGGMLDLYWYENSHIYRKDGKGNLEFDLRPQYRTFYNFIHNLPLNNGHYQDAAATVSDDRLRAWGQKDLYSGWAHLWIQNRAHTWENAARGTAFPSLTGTVKLGGFQPGRNYSVQWCDPYQVDPARQLIRVETVPAQADGSLVLNVADLQTDVAVKIFPSFPFHIENRPNLLDKQ